MRKGGISSTNCKANIYIYICAITPCSTDVSISWSDSRRCDFTITFANLSKESLDRGNSNRHGSSRRLSLEIGERKLSFKTSSSSTTTTSYHQVTTDQ